MSERSAASTSPRGRAQEQRWREFVDEVRRDPSVPFEEQWRRFNEIYRDRPPEDGPPPAWWPTARERERSNLARLMADRGEVSFRELRRWSVEQRADFWRTALERIGAVMRTPPRTTLDLQGGVESPRWLPGAELNCVDSCFAGEASRLAVVVGQEGSEEVRCVSLGSLEQLVNRVARGLRERGVARGDGVALYMPMTLECVAAYLGVVRAGGVVISIADSFPVPELRGRLEIGGARAVVTVERLVRGGREFALYDRVREADAPLTVVVGDPGCGRDLREGDLWWGDLLSGDGSFDSEVSAPEGTTNVLFSSGTTSQPKAIPWTHLTPFKCAVDGHLHQDIQRGDVVAWPTNIGWMMGPWLIYASLINGAALALYEGLPTGAGFAHFVERGRVSVLGVVPALVRAWRSNQATEQAKWEGVRLFSSTGEPSSQEDYLWLMSRTGYRAPVIEYCGGTEIGGGHLTGSLLQPASPAVFTTPVLGLDFALLDEEGREVEEGETGELFLIPPSVGMSQTLLNRDHHDVYFAGCPSGPRGEVLRRHGDQVERLAHGCYRAQGRADDAMNLGGIKVASQEIERVLSQSAALEEVAAVAVPPAGGGADRLVVFVVVVSNVDIGRLGDQLGQLLRRELNPLFKIFDVVPVDALPRTASNKVMRRELRARYTGNGPSLGS